MLLLNRDNISVYSVEMMNLLMLFIQAGCLVIVMCFCQNPIWKEIIVFIVIRRIVREK